MKKLTIFAIAASLALVVCIPVDPTNLTPSNIHPSHGQQNATVSQEHHSQSSQIPNNSSLQDNKEKENHGKIDNQPKGSNMNMDAGNKPNGTIPHVQPPQTTNHSAIQDNKEKENIAKKEEQLNPSNMNMTNKENGQQNATTYQDHHSQLPEKNSISLIENEKQKGNNGKAGDSPETGKVNTTSGDKGHLNATTYPEHHIKLPQTIADIRQNENYSRIEEHPKAIVNTTVGDNGIHNSTIIQDHHIPMHQTSNVSPFNTTINLDKSQQKANDSLDHHGQLLQKSNTTLDEENKKKAPIEKEEEYTRPSSVNITGAIKGKQSNTSNQDLNDQLSKTMTSSNLNITNEEKGQENVTPSQGLQVEFSTINTSLNQDSKQIDNNGKIDEQDKDGKEDSISTFRQIWNQMSAESRKNCVEKYLKDEKNDAEYQKMTQAEREAEWNKKTEEEKACVFHMYEERRKEASEKLSGGQKNHEAKNDVGSSNTTNSSSEVKKEHKLIIKKEEEKNLRQFWFTMNLDQKTSCYEMYNRHEHPSKSETTAWKSLTKVERVAEINAIWHTLSMEIKACAVHIHDEEIKAEEEKRINMSGKFYDNNTKNTNAGNMKKDVYGVVSKEEANRLRHLWFTLDVDFKTKCYEMYKENEHPTKSETDEWNNMDQNKRKEDIVEIWQTLPDNMKACSIHIRDEEAKLEDVDRKKNVNGQKKSVFSLVTEEDAKRLRQVWFTLDLYHYQKILKEYKKCYEMYTYDEHPTKKEATYWKSLSQEKRREEILIIWQTLPENIKACALHIADEEAKSSKKEYMKKQETKNDSEQKKKVHGVVTEVEANRLRHLWTDLSHDKKTQCFELYKKNEHPSKTDAAIWKRMNPKMRREEIFREWHNLSDSLKACAIHIADYEAKLEKEKKNKTFEIAELKTNDKKINNKETKEAVSSNLHNKDEGKPVNSKSRHQICRILRMLLDKT